MDGKLVSLRAVTQEDKDRIRGWSNDPEVASFVDRVRPVSEVEHAKWFDSILQDNMVVFFAIEEKENKVHIGNVWLYNIDYRHRKAELRILIGDKRYWGKGYGREAIKLLVDFAFNKLNLNKVYAYVLSSNPRAKKMFELCGFKVEGELINEYFSNGKYINGFRLAVLMK